MSGSTLTLTTPLHWTFKTAQKAQISRVGTPRPSGRASRTCSCSGGRPGGYPGQNAGGIDVSDAANCWVKDVQVDGTTSGMPIRLAGTYRCVVRDSHFHNSYSYGFAQDNYGIVLACGAADNLVENNIARFMNKPMLVQQLRWRQRHRLQLRRQFLGVRRQQRRRLPGGQHRLPLRVSAHGAHGGQLGARTWARR